MFELFALEQERDDLRLAVDDEVVWYWLLRHGAVEAWRQNSKLRVIWTHVQTLFTQLMLLNAQHSPHYWKMITQNVTHMWQISWLLLLNEQIGIPYVNKQMHCTNDRKKTNK